MNIRRGPASGPALALVAVLAAGCLPAVAWLPDGQRIAYVHEGAVWLTDLAGQRTRLYAATGETPWFVSAAPAGRRLAIVSVGNGCTRLALLDVAGRIEWSLTFPGNDAEDAAAPGLAFPAHPWNADGTKLLVIAGQTLLAASIPSRAVEALALNAVDARFSPAGTVIALTGTTTGGLALAGIGDGARRPAPWRVPPGTPDDARPRLTADGSAIWVSSTRTGARTVLADRQGRILFTGAREFESAGPDDRSYLTRDGGWALVRADGATTNLNPAYNRLVQTEVNWQMEGQRAGADTPIKADPEFTSLPAWSPDHTRFAVMTKSLLVVVDVARNEITPIAKW